MLAADGKAYTVNAEFEALRQRYLDRLDARAVEAGWSAERHAAARRPYSDSRHVARELVAEQYAQYLASPEYRRDLKGGARGGYYEMGEIVGSVPFLQKSLGRLGFVFDRTGGIVHSPLFGDYRKSPGVAQAVREYTRARVRTKEEPAAAKRDIDDAQRSENGNAPLAVDATFESNFHPGTEDTGAGKGGSDEAQTRDSSSPQPEPRPVVGGTSSKPRILYHYTTADESSFASGLRADSSVTDKLYTDPYLAGQELGIPVPDKVIPIIDTGQFRENRPHIVRYSPRYWGGGSDFVNRERVPASQILPAQPISKK